VQNLREACDQPGEGAAIRQSLNRAQTGPGILKQGGTGHGLAGQHGLKEVRQQGLGPRPYWPARANGLDPRCSPRLRKTAQGTNSPRMPSMLIESSPARTPVVMSSSASSLKAIASALVQQAGDQPVQLEALSAVVSSAAQPSPPINTEKGWRAGSQARRQPSPSATSNLDSRQANHLATDPA